MNFSEMRDKAISKAYDTKLPYPQYHHDRALRIILADEDRKARDEYHADDARLRNLFMLDLRDSIDDHLGILTNDAQYSAISYKAWEDGHSSGYLDVIYEAEEITETVKKFVGIK